MPQTRNINFLLKLLLDDKILIKKVGESQLDNNLDKEAWWILVKFTRCPAMARQAPKKVKLKT